MLLRNYFNWKYNFQYKYQSVIANTEDQTFGIDCSELGLTAISNVDGYGLIRIHMTAANNYIVVQNNVLDANVGALVGAGTTEVSVNDYALGSAFNSAIVTSSISSIIYENTEDFKIKKLYVITGKNNGSESITINEVGIYKRFHASNPTQGSASRLSENKYLMVRQLLETPITVPAGKEYRITLEVVDDLALTQN